MQTKMIAKNWYAKLGDSDYNILLKKVASKKKSYLSSKEKSIL
jgi:hypothetical protein